MLSRLEHHRIREVRRYYNRSPSDPGLMDEDSQTGSISASETTPISSPNSTLTALMQLIAWRLGMSRAMISVVDQDAQYFLAEATKSLDLLDSRKHDPGDDLWIGCGGTVRSQALCAYTIQETPEPDNYACFCVPDLAADPRFYNLPYVARGPKFRYYAGTPLISKTGFPIGSVFVVDPKPHPPPTKTELEFLGTMAQNAMDYLEMRRESVQLRRNDIMSKGLAALVEGHDTIQTPELAFEKRRAKIDKTNEGNIIDINVVDSLMNGCDPLTAVAAQSLNNIPASLNSTPIDKTLFTADTIFHPTVQKIEGPDTHQRILSRAANLLRESLDVDYTLFLDLSIGFSTDTNNPNDIESDANGSLEGTTKKSHSARPSMIRTISARAMNGHTSMSANSRRGSESSVAKVRSFSTPIASSLAAQTFPKELCQVPSEGDLKGLSHTYPNGKVWTFPDYGADSSSDDESEVPPSKAMHRINMDRIMIKKCFPGATEVLFAPLIEAGTGTPIAGCFAVNCKSLPVFASDSERAFVHGFLNSVSIEYNRISIAAANRQKGDFISSISHELRSPLHGILGSAELLSETSLDKSQSELCSTIETCGRVLQETLMDVLEYSKINKLRKDNNYLEKIASKTISRNHTGTGLTYGEIVSDLKPREEVVLDVARMCEDSVAIVAAAYPHRESSSSGIYHGVEQKPPLGDVVTVSMDIAYHDWNYFCSPGSLQRIVMNLVGNSLKYTSFGFIKVALWAEDGKQNSQNSGTPVDTVVLQVSDSGKGISREFLKNKLFTAFSQESSLAPGTGLGLHIINSLVQMYHGTIDVQSQLGQGTTVTVKLPLRKAANNLGITGPSTTSLNDDLVKLRGILKKISNPTFSTHGFLSNASDSIGASLHEYLTQWFDLGYYVGGENSTNIAFVNESEYEGTLSMLENTQKLSYIILVRAIANKNRPVFPGPAYSLHVPIEILTVPFGPCKLTKALLSCLTPIKTLHPVISPQLEQYASPVTPLSACDSLMDSPPANGLPKQITSEPAGSQPKILCVDDNPINLGLLMKFFKKLKFADVSCAENGALAFEACRQRLDGFDLIFMDLSMPVCDGFDSTRLIRALEELQKMVSTTPLPDSRIVALTGVCSPRDVEAAKMAGMDDFVTKPLKLSTLVGMLKEWGYMDRDLDAVRG